MRRLLVVTAVGAETEAVAAALTGARATRIGPYAALSTPAAAVLTGGVGPAAAAAATATALALGGPFDLVVSAGVAGGFGDVPAGTTLVGVRAVAADLGAAGPDGFLSLDALGFGTGTLEADAVACSCALARLGDAGIAVVSGDLLTVSTVTGTAERATELAARGAVGEAMEGFGVATAAVAHGVPWLEVRAVSNTVGVRDRAAWDLPLALTALTDAAGACLVDA